MVNGIEGVFALIPDPYGMVLKAPDGIPVHDQEACEDKSGG